MEKNHPDGEYDDDEFYILEDGDFFDPFGYYFDEFGMDANNGHYDDDGFYITGIESAHRERATKPCSKEEIEKEEGKYDDDGFYKLADEKGFYDPLGYYFNNEGYDEVGGYYDHYGLYIDPEEEYKGDSGPENEDEEYYDDYDLDGQDEADQLEREAILCEHIIPAQLKVKQNMVKDNDKHFYIRVANIPKIYEEVHILRFFNKQVANFKNCKILPEYIKQKKTKLFTGNVMIQTNDW